ncbi:MAG: hypothetical protein PHW77_07880 [Eubacteriales bacterium]|nr:hypothetical protein [Eubacteriales bacterium]
MNRFRQTANRSSWFFTVSVLIYSLALATGMSDISNDIGIYRLLFKNIVTLFAFSCVFGSSFLLFDTKLPSSAKRLFHILILYAAMLASAFIMANAGTDARQIILFVFMATLLYIVIYSTALIVSKAVKKMQKK